MRDLLTRELESLPPGAPRVRAWLLLSEADVRTRAEYQEHVARALAEAGEDPALRRSRARPEGPQHGRGGRRADPGGRGLGARGAARRRRGRAPRAERAELDAQPARACAGRHPRALRPPGGAHRRLARAGRGPAAPLARRARPGARDDGALPGARGRARRGRLVRLAAAEPVRARAARGGVGRRRAAARRVGRDRRRRVAVTPTYRRCRALLAVGRGDHEEAPVGRRSRWARPRRGATRGRCSRPRARSASPPCSRTSRPGGRAPARRVGTHASARGSTSRARSRSPGSSSRRSTELGELDEARAVSRQTACQATTTRGRGHPRPLPGRATASEAAAAAYERLGLRFDAARACSPTAARSGGRATGVPPGTRSDRPRRRSTRSARPGWAADARPSSPASVGASRARPTSSPRPSSRSPRSRPQGRTNKEIAHALFVTVHTVEAHLSNTYAKLGVRSRRAARRAALATRPRGRPIAPAIAAKDPGSGEYRPGPSRP